ncbi:MAG: pseudouridine synthase, partial [Desulfitobacteriaceae bacterium]|nr:pseudouridine synthase [Desulfitobacteriaceae bacterium]
MEERLQKILAHAGVASRRACEDLILSGKVKVDGRVVRELGTKVDLATSCIEVEGQVVQSKEESVYVLLYKPSGYVSTVLDPHNRPIVLDLVKDIKARIYPVGRLDYDTSGLLLMTNDGELTNNLIHPSQEVEKIYHAWVKGIPSLQELSHLSKGVMLEDGKTAPARVILKKIQGGNALIEIAVHEGKNRQVKRMFDALG